MATPKEALVELRDAAHKESNAERPDLRVIAEKFEAFRSAWASSVDAEIEEVEAAKAEETPKVEAKPEPKSTAKEAPAKK